MRVLLFTLLISAFLLFSVPPVYSENIIKQTESHNVFKGLFYSIWSKLRTLNPHQRQSAKSTTVYTAGIRGAESTDTLFQPYWKNDLTNDKAFQAELQQFTVAQLLMDKGDLVASVKAFSAFINQYSSSNLLANALIGKGVSLAGMGKNSEASLTLKQFVDGNPSHPLAADAQQIMAQLK